VITSSIIGFELPLEQKSVSSNERDYSFTELSILDQLRH
jgi:hypothetical protein